MTELRSEHPQLAAAREAVVDAACEYQSGDRWPDEPLFVALTELIRIAQLVAWAELPCLNPVETCIPPLRLCTTCQTRVGFAALEVP